MAYVFMFLINIIMKAHVLTTSSVTNHAVYVIFLNFPHVAQKTTEHNTTAFSYYRNLEIKVSFYS